MDASTHAGNDPHVGADRRQRWGPKPNRHRHDDYLSRVDPEQFEHLIADYFRCQGWHVEVVGAAASGRNFDGGIDLKLRRDNQYIVVQCKRWNANQVTHNTVHELLGVMQTEGATGAIVVTSGEFTPAACAAAARSGRIQLLDGTALRQLLDPIAIQRALASSKPSNAPPMSAEEYGIASPRRRRASYKKPGPRRALRFIAGLIGFAVLSLLIARMLPAFLHPAAAVAVGPSTPSVLAPPPRVAPPTTYDLAGHLLGAQAAAVVGADETSRAHLQAFSHDMARTMRLPDATRPIDHESARAAVRPLPGVRSVIWLDHVNFVVMVDGQVYRSPAMIDEVCRALAPLGDTLAVAVNLQDATAKNGDAAMTLSRNCQLAVGQRALLQGKRQVDVVAPELRETIKRQQEGSESFAEGRSESAL